MFGWQREYHNFVFLTQNTLFWPWERTLLLGLITCLVWRLMLRVTFLRNRKMCIKIPPCPSALTTPHHYFLMSVTWWWCQGFVCVLLLQGDSGKDDEDKGKEAKRLCAYMFPLCCCTLAFMWFGVSLLLLTPLETFLFKSWARVESAEDCVSGPCTGISTECPKMPSQTCQSCIQVHRFHVRVKHIQNMYSFYMHPAIRSIQILPACLLNEPAAVPYSHSHYFTEHHWYCSSVTV